MKFATFQAGGAEGVGVVEGDTIRGALAADPDFPGPLDTLIAAGPEALMAAGAALATTGRAFALDAVCLLAPYRRAPKIVCVGLNYRDHTAEAGFVQPAFPTLFGRFPSSLTGPFDRLALTPLSDEFDFEGELAVVIGKGGRDIPQNTALDHVLGYAVFNDSSFRDYQFKSPQWTAGKNFDETGAFGPYLVTADELPPGCRGLELVTRLNGAVVQRAMIDDMVFDVAELIHILSTFMTLEPGDLIVSGTPAGVGMGREPRLWMKAGDLVEVEVGGVGRIANRVEFA